MKNRYLHSFAILTLGTPLIHASTIANASFEADTFVTFPGYIANPGNGPITGWVTNANANTGLNPGGGNPFANNGSVPEGSNVGFLQGNPGFARTISSVDGITGLVAGRTYNLTYRVNSRAGNEPDMGLIVDGATVLQNRINAVGGSNPYKTVSINFVATGPTASLTLRNDALTDQTLLFDDFQVNEVTPSITVSPWTDDASSGIDSSLDYTHAVNLGTSSGTSINGVPFVGVAGGNPSLPGSFSYNMGNVFGADVNNITVGGSATLSESFVFGNAAPTLTLEGLEVGQLYRTSLFTVGFDASGDGRASTITSPNGEMLTVDVNSFGNDNGARIDIEFLATDTTENIELTALFGPSSFHTYAFSNAAIPEPSVLGVLAFSALGLGLRRRR